MEIGRYEVIRDLKAGGMAKTMLALSQSGRLVVLKTPHDADAEVAARMRDEARVGTRLLHPGLVETLDMFEHDGRPVLVVGYIRGASVEMLRKRGPLPAAAVFSLGAQIARALDALHTANDESDVPLKIIHRDVSGANILIDKEGRARLIDLGIARWSSARSAITEPGAVVGTMRYLAPEVLLGEAQSAMSDIWALGCVLLEAATGAPCWQGGARDIVGQLHNTDPLTASNFVLDVELRAWLAPILARNGAERATCAQIAEIAEAAEQKLAGTAALAIAVEETMATIPDTTASDLNTAKLAKTSADPRSPDDVDDGAPIFPPIIDPIAPPAATAADTPKPGVSPLTLFAAAFAVAVAFLLVGSWIYLAGKRPSQEDLMADANELAPPSALYYTPPPESAAPPPSSASAPPSSSSASAPPSSMSLSAALSAAASAAESAPPGDEKKWAPACWSPGRVIAFEERGISNMVDKPEKVPVSARPFARCIGR